MADFFSSLYIHVPFCIEKCKYCNFYSVKWAEEYEEIYIKALLKEIELTSSIPHLVETIYIGGGTPSCLSYKGLKKILESIRKRYFIKDNIEFSIELNPATVDMRKLEMFKSYGINRLSIGVQSYNDLELKLLGRIHNSKSVVSILKKVEKKGFENISIDLIYGIPFQTQNTWKNSLKFIKSFDIKHVSLYELTLEENTKLFNEILSGRYTLPNEEDILSMYIFANQFLSDNSFEKYEISNFAIKEYKCRHNINYWRRKPYLGLGPSAHSFINNRRFHNPAELLKYSKTLINNKLSWIEDYFVHGKEKLKEKIFLSLRTSEGMIIKRRCLNEIFRNFEKEKLVRISKHRVSLTDKGMVLSNELFVQVLLHIENCPFCKRG